MMRLSCAAMLLLSASGLSAQEARQMGAHEHGVGQLNIAFDGDQIAMELHAPGADIVGFEYAATRAEDVAKVTAAVAALESPLELFSFPAAAGCTVIDAMAALENEEGHEGHEDHEGHEGHEGHEDHEGHEGHGDHEGDDDHDTHDHGDAHDEDHEEDEHAEHDHDDHDDHKEHDDDHKDDEHAGHDHDDHKDDDHKDEAHGDEGHDNEGHDHETEASEAGHTEFHAEYLLTCSDMDAVKGMEFPYFVVFSNALELEVQVISDRGATAAEVTRSVPVLDLR
jgi:hypothetical protein